MRALPLTAASIFQNDTAIGTLGKGAPSGSHFCSSLLDVSQSNLTDQGKNRAFQSRHQWGMVPSFKREFQNRVRGNAVGASGPWDGLQGGCCSSRCLDAPLVTMCILETHPGRETALAT